MMNIISITTIVSVISHMMVRAKFAIAHEIPLLIAIKRVGKKRRHTHNPKEIKRTSSFSILILS